MLRPHPERTAMEMLFADVRQSVRRLRSSPGFTLVAVLTLALGIGATTAIYSIVDGLMLRPLPYRDAGRLVEITAANAAGNTNYSLPITRDRLDYWRRQTGVFEAVEGYATRSAVVTGAGEPESLIGAALTGGMMRMLAVAPQAGRVIEPDDTSPGNDRIVVLSDALWRQRFAAAPDIVGRSIRLDDKTYTIVGVMPRQFTFPYGRRQFWVPLVLDPSAGAAPVRMNVTARVRPDLTVPLAQTRVDALVPTLRNERILMPGWTMRLSPPLARHLNAPVRRALLVLAVAVSLVWLIACANLANLLLVQGADRGREMAVRTALGASRRQLVRQLLTETSLLAAGGGALGLLLAVWCIDLVAAFTPREMTFLNTDAIRLDGRVLTAEILLTFLTAAAFGLLPAIRVSRRIPQEALKDGRGAPGAPRQERLRRAFALAQVALSLVLLVGAGLLGRTFMHITRLDPGFDARNIVVVDLSPVRWKYPTRPLQQQLFDDVAARVRSLPGVRATTVTGGAPPRGGGLSFGLKFEIEGRGVVLDDPNLVMPFSEVDGNYFAFMGIPLKAGRTFSADDTPDSPRVVIIGEEMARRLWNGENPVGRRIRWDADRPWYTVVGVAGDVYQLRPEEPRGQFAVYYANSQARGIPGQQTLVVRTAEDPSPLMPLIREQIRSVDPDQPIARMQHLDAAYAEFFATPRFYAFLMSAFALMGLAMTSIGLYGVLAYSVSQRTREFGIRTALGAQRAQVVWLALRSGLLVACAGVAAGVAGSLALTGMLDALLVDIRATDPVTYVLVALLLTGVSVMACWLPARRAARVDPVIALRHE